MSISDAKHPLWSLIRLTILMATLSFVLWLNASHFDETEIRSITWIFIGAASIEGGIQTVQRLGGKK